jgi:hypothetical protein
VDWPARSCGDDKSIGIPKYYASKRKVQVDNQHVTQDEMFVALGWETCATGRASLSHWQFVKSAG